MNTRILIVSYLADKPWLEYCLRSIRKYASGFSGTSVVVPNDEFGDFADMADAFDVSLHGYERDPDRRKWHLHAQATKCFADYYCPDDDFVLHTDSDCVFTEQVTPATYFTDGKPDLLYEAYARIGPCPWQAVTEAVLKRSVEFEFMRRHPQVNPRDVYGDLRMDLEQKHGTSFKDFVLSRKADFPWGFTEHNIIGAFAYYSPRWHDAYHWIDTATEKAPHEKLWQFWTGGAMDKPQRSPHSGGALVTPLETLRKFGLR